MTMIVGGTGLAAFGTSATLLALGVSSMPARYLVAVLVAYSLFLLLVRWWAEYTRRRLAGVDLMDLLPDVVPGGADAGALDPWMGGGGRFGGAGAGREWASDASAPDATPPAPVSTGGVSTGGALDVDLDEAWVLVVPVLVAVGGLLAAAYVVYAAPVLLAEVLLDVVLVSGLYRRLRKVDSRSWLSTAVRMTWAPAAAVLLLVVGGAFAIQAMVPWAASIGDLFRVRGG